MLIPYYSWSHSWLRNSKILRHPEDSLLISFFPESTRKMLSTYSAVTIYNTEDHGFGLRPLYNQCALFANSVIESCILLVRTVKGVTIGAFLSNLPNPQPE